MILIALGSNLSGPWGSPKNAVQTALKVFAREGIGIKKSSTLIETAPLGKTNQPNFVNAVVWIETHKSPDALMRCLHSIEREAGRKRLTRWGPRTLDLDLLDYHGLVRKPSGSSIKPLALPHPGIAQRSFVLEPIREIAPQWKHPVSRQSAALTLRKLYGLNRI